MEHVVFVPFSVYLRESLNTKTFTQQKPPNYQREQNATYQIDSLRKETNKNFFFPEQTPK